MEAGKQESPEKNLGGRRKLATTQPTYDTKPELNLHFVQHRPHWWETSAFTTVPTMLPILSSPILFSHLAFIIHTYCTYLIIDFPQGGFQRQYFTEKNDKPKEVFTSEYIR